MSRRARPAARECYDTETMGEPAPEIRSLIPDRLFFRIGDVAELTGLEPHVLRYWESEFSVLRPRKTSNGQRQYRQKDIETTLEIKRLLYEEGYTIAGARKALRERRRKKKEAKAARQAKPSPRRAPVQTGLFGPTPEEQKAADLAMIKKELREILALLR